MPGYYRRRLLLLLAVFAATTLFVLVGHGARIPYYPGFESALCTMPSPAGRTVIVLVTLIVATAIGTLIAGRVRLEVGLFAAAVGLCSLSTRAGRMQYVWMHEEMGGLARRLAIELALLGTTFLGLWAGLSFLNCRKKLNAHLPEISTSEAPSHRNSDAFTAFAVHLIVTGLLTALLLASDSKKQAIVGIALASCIGAITASLTAPNARIGYWLLAPPFLIGIAGYLIASNPSATDGGFFAHLLRASPLDYAGAGTAGAIFGRWLGVNTEPGTSTSGAGADMPDATAPDAPAQRT